MRPIDWTLLIIPLLATAGCLALWAATGRDAYTKYTVVEKVIREQREDDLFAGTGLFDDEDGSATEVVRRDEFRFGLLPTPQRLFDKHMVSVASISGPLWGISLVSLWILRRQRKRPPTHKTRLEKEKENNA